MRFTRQSVAALSLPPQKSEHVEWDDALPGFGVRIRPGGKRWVVQFRGLDGKSTKRTLGNPDVVAPDAARAAARKLLARVQVGDDVKGERAEKRARAAVTFGATADVYLNRFAAQRLRPKTLVDVTRYLRVDWKPLHSLPLEKVDRRLVAARLGDLAGAAPVAANRARAALSAFLSWAMREGLVDANSAIGTNRADERSRERVLRDDELAVIWRACRDDGYGSIVRLLILLGQRREEVGAISDRELKLEHDRGHWSIPGERTKNGRPHEVPLPSPAAAILRGFPRVNGRPFLFGDGAGPFSGWSKARRALDARIACGQAELTPWRLHDLRRTVATGMANLGVQPHVIEAVLNHVSGHKAGVAGVYNRAAYAPEKRQALDLWAAHIERVVAGEDANVVSLHSGAHA
jgi:integrase